MHRHPLAVAGRSAVAAHAVGRGLRILVTNQALDVLTGGRQPRQVETAATHGWVPGRSANRAQAPYGSSRPGKQPLAVGPGGTAAAPAERMLRGPGGLRPDRSTRPRARAPAQRCALRWPRAAWGAGPAASIRPTSRCQPAPGATVPARRARLSPAWRPTPTTLCAEPRRVLHCRPAPGLGEWAVARASPASLVAASSRDRRHRKLSGKHRFRHRLESRPP